MPPRRRILGAWGFSLLEMAIVLAIAGLAVSGIWLATSEVQNNNRKTELLRGTVKIITTAKSIFHGQNSALTNYTTADGIAAGIFPADWVSDVNGTLRVLHPFVRRNLGIVGDPVGLLATSGQLQLILGGRNLAGALPQDACIDLVLKLATAQNFTDMGIIDLSIRGGSEMRLTTANLPPDLEAVTNSCANRRNGAVIGITFDPIN
jgi:prepilin-type N-terminal cleavage/methylation domain-containing protein